MYPLTQPHQNYSQKLRLLPYMEQPSTYNAWNHAFGARWTDVNMIQNELPNGTIVIEQISSFLCPSDSNKGSAFPNNFQPNGPTIAGASNYPSNIGMNRHINGGGVGFNWQNNGPNYILSTLGCHRPANDLDGLIHRWNEPAPRSSVSGSKALPTARRTRTVSAWSIIFRAVYPRAPSRPIFSSLSLAHGSGRSTPIKRELQRRVVDVGPEPDLLAHEPAQSLLL